MRTHARTYTRPLAHTHARSRAFAHALAHTLCVNSPSNTRELFDLSAFDARTAFLETTVAKFERRCSCARGLLLRMRAAVAAPTFFPPYVRPEDQERTTQSETS
eukprot:36896-Pleurochrysis_carterae.AAC.2